MKNYCLHLVKNHRWKIQVKRNARFSSFCREFSPLDDKTHCSFSFPRDCTGNQSSGCFSDESSDYEIGNWLIQEFVITHLSVSVRSLKIRPKSSRPGSLLASIRSNWSPWSGARLPKPRAVDSAAFLKPLVVRGLEWAGAASVTVSTMHTVAANA